MKKLSLKRAADEFEVIDSDTNLFYNIETGEFEFYNDHWDTDEEDWERIEEDDAWIAAPRQMDLDEYNIMVEFAETRYDSQKSELLCVALEGAGAIRRFEDTLHHVGLVEEWYAFKSEAFVNIAREWCIDNGIEYVD